MAHLACCPTLRASANLVRADLYQCTFLAPNQSGSPWVYPHSFTVLRARRQTLEPSGDREIDSLPARALRTHPRGHRSQACRASSGTAVMLPRTVP